MSDSSKGQRRGELVWRGVRYCVAIVVGYMLGIAAAGLAQDTPAFPLLVMLGALALFLVFRQGAKSQSHAAADAISAANARASAAAQASATQTVTIAGGHVQHRYDPALPDYEQTYLAPPGSPGELPPYRDQGTFSEVERRTETA